MMPEGNGFIGPGRVRHQQEGTGRWTVWSTFNSWSMMPSASRRSGVCGGPRACVAQCARVTRWSGMVMTTGSQSANVIAARPDRRVDDLSDTIFAGHHQPLRIWILCLYFMGLNLSNHQVARELDLNVGDVQVMTERLRAGIMAARPA